MPSRFLDPRSTSLKICGVTRADDGERLAELGVDALGANFWPGSKRYLDPSKADFLGELQGRILRVGVFVNAGFDLPRSLYEEGWIDLVQLHGDETSSDCLEFAESGIPFIKAFGVRGAADLATAEDFGALGILLDAHAPGIYGGTGETIDWHLVRRFVGEHPKLPVILAGGITPENIGSAISTARPAAVDVASGAEISPGVKDFTKVAALLAACRS